MTVEQAIAARRTVRRFEQQPVAREHLRALADAGRLAASAGNRQPCRFLAVARPDLGEQVFPHLGWLAAAGAPPPGARPTAYMVILADRAVNPNYASDCAAAAQNMLLAAHERGLGACWIGSVKRDALGALLALPDHLDLYAVIALGYPAEQAVAEDADDAVTVERGADGRLHVRKRPLEAVLRFEVWESP